MISALNKIAAKQAFGGFALTSFGFVPYASKFGEHTVLALAVMLTGMANGVEQSLLAIFRSAGNNLYKLDASGELVLLGGYGYDRSAKGWTYRAGSWTNGKANVEAMLGFAKSTLRRDEGKDYIGQCAEASGIVWNPEEAVPVSTDASPLLAAALANKAAGTDIVGLYFSAIREQLGTQSPLGEQGATDDTIPF